MIYGFERERERERSDSFFDENQKKKVGEGNQITSLFRRYHNIILVTVSKPTSKGIISYNCYLNLHSCLKRKEKKKNPWRRLFSTRKSTFNMCKIVFMSSTMKRNSMSMKLSGLKFIVLNSEGRCWNYIFCNDDQENPTLTGTKRKSSRKEKRKCVFVWSLFKGFNFHHASNFVWPIDEYMKLLQITNQFARHLPTCFSIGYEYSQQWKWDAFNFIYFEPHDFWSYLYALFIIIEFMFGSCQSRLFWFSFLIY